MVRVAAPPPTAASIEWRLSAMLGFYFSVNLGLNGLATWVPRTWMGLAWLLAAATLGLGVARIERYKLRRERLRRT